MAGRGKVYLDALGPVADYAATRETEMDSRVFTLFSQYDHNHTTR